MNSFYGGPNGAPFKISKVFNTVYYNNTFLAIRNLTAEVFNTLIKQKKLYSSNDNDTLLTEEAVFNSETTYYLKSKENSLQHDLEQRWQSNIGVDEYVIVMYGLPSDNEPYSTYQKVDFDKDGRNYNGTLWQKVYKEDAVNDETEISAYNGQVYNDFIFTNGTRQGWGYKLIGSFAGQTPYFSLIENPVEASQPHRVQLNFAHNEAAIDKPILTFDEPKEWKFGFTGKNVKANQNPSVEFFGVYGDTVTKQEYNTNNYSKPSATTQAHSIKHFDIQLPEAWQFQYTRQQVNASESPSVRLFGTATNITDINAQPPTEATGEHSIKHFHFTVPESWRFQKSDEILLEASQNPIISFYGVGSDGKQTTSAHSIKEFKFSLPKAWNFTSELSIDLNASENPTVDFYGIDSEGNLATGDHSTKKLEIHMPQAWQFVADVDSLSPGEDPVVEFKSGNINSGIFTELSNGETRHSAKQFTIKVPKAWQFSSTVPISYNDIANPSASLQNISDENGKTIKQLQIQLTTPKDFEIIGDDTTNENPTTSNTSFSDYFESNKNNLVTQAPYNNLYPYQAVLTFFKNTGVSDSLTSGFLIFKIANQLRYTPLAASETGIIIKEEIDNSIKSSKFDIYNAQAIDGALVKYDSVSETLSVSDNTFYSTKATDKRFEILLNAKTFTGTGDSKLYPIPQTTWVQDQLDTKLNISSLYSQTPSNSSIDKSKVCYNITGTQDYISSRIKGTTITESASDTWTINAIKSHVETKLNTLKNISFTDANSDGNVTIQFIAGGTN